MRNVQNEEVEWVGWQLFFFKTVFYMKLLFGTVASIIGKFDQKNIISSYDALSTDLLI